MRRWIMGRIAIDLSYIGSGPVLALRTALRGVLDRPCSITIYIR
jgi:hypothetical protein